MNEQEARQVACDWHSGQWSPLYAFCSSGTITDVDILIAEVNDCAPEGPDIERLWSLVDYVYRQFPEPDNGP